VKLAECIVDAELPAGVFSMVTGPGAVVGDEVAASPGTHGIGFIGSVATGLTVAASAAGKAPSHLPFGGRAGSSSGIGRVGGSSVLDAFTEPKTVVVTLGSASSGG
jgi:acyl-CoA reductase-like NAD-dependent aldehyde dehydrogenase